MRSASLAAVAVALLAALAAGHTIKHVVVLMEENRSFDHLFGWRQGLKYGLNSSIFNWVNGSNHAQGKVFVNNRSVNVNPGDPCHNYACTTEKIFGMPACAKLDFSHPDMSGFVEWQAKGGGRPPYSDVMASFAPANLPVINSLADHFGHFDKFFASFAGATWPNRLFHLMGTSGGNTRTQPWYYQVSGWLFPQRTIFDQLHDAGHSWKNYVNDTPWELFVETIAHNPEKIVLMDEFFADAKAGTLPSFSYINPRAGSNLTLGVGCNDQHPDHDVALGERYYKDIYEALRASPAWNDTLFIITYDEHGGFHDHIPPPMHVPSPDDWLFTYPDFTAQFDRLGIRIPTVLISPWMPKGVVVSDAPAHAKPANNSEFTLTSIMATVRNIFNITEGPLTKRDGWSATFDYLFETLTEPRTDCPMHLPDAKPAAQSVAHEVELPLNHLQRDIAAAHEHVSGLPMPAHVTKQGDVSAYLADAFQHHKAATMAWKRSKAAATKAPNHLVVRCELDGANPTSENHWRITHNASAAKYVTVSAAVDPKYKVKGQAAVDYCLDAGNGTAGEAVTLTRCYPSANPGFNRDRGQHWVRQGVTLRPFGAQQLCLVSNCMSTALLTEFRRLRLALCDPAHELQQRWAFGANLGAADAFDGADIGSIGIGQPMYNIVVDWSALLV
jgi:phospholipase C